MTGRHRLEFSDPEKNTGSRDERLQVRSGMATPGAPAARIEGELATLAPSAFPALVDQPAGGAQQTAGLQARGAPHTHSPTLSWARQRR